MEDRIRFNQMIRAKRKKKKLIKIFGIIFLVSVVLFIISWFIPIGNWNVLMPVFPIALISALVSGTSIYYISTGQWDRYFKGISQTGYNARHIPQAVKTEVWRRNMGRCVQCGSQERLEFDHIIPFSKGGSNTVRNIQLLCENCNRSKHDNIGF